MSDEPKSGGSGCLKVAGIGCGVIVVLGIIAGVVLYSNKDKIIQSVGGVAIEKGADLMFDSLDLPANEKEAAMVHVRDLSGRIKKGEISVEQALQVLESLAEGPLPVVIILRLFEAKYVKGASLTEDEKKEAHISITRFAQGLIDSTIDKAKSEEIAAIITDKTRDASGKETTKLKETISDAELKKCLKLMKDAADAAGVANKEFKVDIAEEIRKAIAEGLAKVAAEKSAQPEN